MTTIIGVLVVIAIIGLIVYVSGPMHVTAGGRPLPWRIVETVKGLFVIQYRFRFGWRTVKDHDGFTRMFGSAESAESALREITERELQMPRVIKEGQ